ncbi:MAG: glycine cleavage system aminomethyltransferase GcvT, partial [Anaerolineae bacterium]|nr:glycine cleavage system aminomethyltransferase GcvT [Anaerolineae bacterium]
MIPSESTAPAAVREGLGSVFQNIYAEGYPDEEQRVMSEAEILDFDTRLAHYRRYADPRYYKGVEYADLVESLARRRCAELFATPAFPAEKLFVNVQPLSGAPANNAVYTALLTPGDTILGMNLLHGGHLSHGSSVNRSGKLFKAVHYAVDPVTERIDYDAVQALASEHKPKIIIAGYSSYPWVPDWTRFRAIADSVGATLLADISHIAGLVAAGVVASPVGIAHVITFTTHKTLCGPRGACIITTDGPLGRKIDRAVFPGEQGGPHIHAIAGMATAFKLAKTEQFKALQNQIVRNSVALTARLAERGLRIPFTGTDTHLTNVDCKTVKGPDGTPLSGDMAARILDIAGIVINRNTIPGDKTALNSSGIRLGTPWITQRGLVEADMVEVADCIADVMFACTPYTIDTRQGPAQRAKVDFVKFEEARLRIRKLAEKAGIDFESGKHAYPHFFYLDDQPAKPGKQTAIQLTGKNVGAFVNYAFASATDALNVGQSQPSSLVTPVRSIEGTITRTQSGFTFQFEAVAFGLAATWLRDLSDGYVFFDQDVTRRMPGPILISECEPVNVANLQPTTAPAKPYHIGMTAPLTASAKPEFTWTEPENPPLKRTPLFETHKALGGRMVPFAGWEMPVQYTSVVEEHMATRTAAGLFDVAHMGVYQAEGPNAVDFLDSVCGNDIAALAVGESCYTHFLDPDAQVIDDTLVYRRGEERYLVVVNASNDDKDWAWLNSVLDGTVLVDRENPAARAFGQTAVLRNLRDPKAGADMRVDIALQGPKSRDILLAMGVDAPTRKRIMALKRTELCEAVVGGFELVVSRTGYTGEKMAFELFVHPDQAVALWNAIMTAGAPLGCKPCGLAARDSLRTEAGLPLYGHEMGGEKGLGVAEAGFGTYVKTYKPWFIGRAAYLEREKKRSGVVVRFRFNEKGVRVAHLGDPAVDTRGRVIGYVTSCSIDCEGYLTGQAYLESKAAVEGTPIAIYQSASKSAGKAPA